MSKQETKTCVKCQKEHPITKFKTNGYDKNGERGRMATCSYCTAEAKKLREGLKGPRRDISAEDSASSVSGSTISGISKSSGLSDEAIKQINDSFKVMMETIRGSR